MCVCVCVCTAICRQTVSETDYLVVSQLFRVARLSGHFKLGLKPTQLYVRLSILLLSYQAIYIYIYIYIYMFVLT